MQRCVKILKAIGEELSEIFQAPPLPRQIYMSYIYIKKRSYSNGTLCPNLKAIGEELSEF
jgi:hypothetical protein